MGKMKLSTNVERIMNRARIKIHDQSKRRDYNRNQYLFTQEKKFKMNNPIKGNALISKNKGENNHLHIRPNTLYQLLNFAMIQLLLLIYILNTYKNKIVREEKIVSICTISKEKKPTLMKKTTKIRNRILAEMSQEKEESSTASTVSEDEKKDWSSRLSDDIVKIIHEYTSMVKELKNRIFLSNLELLTFLDEMKEKKKIVEIHAPELFNKNEDKDITEAKVLHYYTQCLNKDSKIMRFKNSLCHFIVFLNNFRDELNTYDEKRKTQIRNRVSSYSDKLKKTDPATFMLIEKRKQNIEFTLRDELDCDQFDEYGDIFEAEFAVIAQAHFMGHVYADLLRTIQESRSAPISEKLIERLFNIEKMLLTIVPDFYNLYKWKKLPSQ